MPNRPHTVPVEEYPSDSLHPNLRAFVLILMAGLGLVVTLALSFAAYYQTGIIKFWPMVRGGIFCAVLLFLIELLFLAGYRAFAQFFRTCAIILAIFCLFSASYFVSQREDGFRNLGVSFVLLCTVPLISFYLASFSLTIRKYLDRRRRQRDRGR